MSVSNRSFHFFNESIPCPLLEVVADPARLCPMLAGPALITGGCLTVRTAQGEVEVNAPPALLKKVFQACDGTRSIHDIV
jgi:ribosomal protein S12 methylthiotransferase accessory factor